MLFPWCFRHSQLILLQTVPDEHKGVGVSPATNLEQPPSIQAMPEQKSTVIDKGKLPANKATTRYNYEVPPSSLSADPSSATWASHPSEGLSHGVVSLLFSPVSLPPLTI